MLEVASVAKAFGTKQAVSDVSFTARPGRVLALLGPNGAGKTTSVRMIANIFAPDAGSIRWKGRALERQRQTVFGYLPETTGFYSSQKMNEQVQYFCEIKAQRPWSQLRKRAAALVERLGLWPYLRLSPRELSKGTVQKFQLVCALTHDPELLLLDEPFSGLDPLSQQTIADVIAERVTAGVAVVMSSHRLEALEELTDDVCIIADGRVRVNDALGHVKELNGKKTVKVNRSCDVAVIAAELGGHPVRSDERFLYVATSADVPPKRVLDAVLRRGELTHFEVMQPSLAEIYRSYVTQAEVA